jgi:hypothetical protein
MPEEEEDEEEEEEEGGGGGGIGVVGGRISAVKRCDTPHY